MALESMSSLPASCLTRTRVGDRAAALFFRGGIAIGDRRRRASSGVEDDEEKAICSCGLLATPGLSRRALGLLLLLFLVAAAAAAAARGRAAAGSIRERESEKERKREKKV